jgi:eukaryotic-like serine/threonine-protein kinase
VECPDVEDLERFVANELGPDVATNLTRHLRTCPCCRRGSAVLLRALVGESPTATTLVRQRGEAPVEFDGASIDRYHLIEPIGAGAMGVVFRARDPVLDRDVAVKIIDGWGLDSYQRECLLREARAMARVAHPNVIPVHDAGIVDDDVYVTMSLVEGANLRKWLAENPTMPRRLEVCIGAARGLAGAHRAGVVHCDVKPDNILIGHDDTAMIGDFGLARRFDRADRRESGTPVGTRRYMAPEVEAGGPATFASDQFSLAITIHEALTGSRVTGEVSLQVPPILRTVLEQALSTEPPDRFPSVQSIVEALVYVRDAGLFRPR